MTRRPKDRPAFAPGPTRNLALDLLRIWDVRADRRYDIKCNHPERALITIRSREGTGELQLDDGSRLPLSAPSYATIEKPKLRRYRCVEEPWAFWWFEYTTADPFPSALNQPFKVRGQSSDVTAFDEIFSKLQHPSIAERAVSSATFSVLLHRWLAEIRQRRAPRHRRVIETIIDRIHGDLSADWSLPRLAAEAGLCQTLFRKEFKRATGTPPAAFVRRARLHAAAQMLELGTYTLAAIAEQLHFSSAFHLSAAFKKQFGVPPSRIQEKDSPNR